MSKKGVKSKWVPIKWERVFGSNLDVNNEKRMKENENILNSEVFTQLCTKFGIKKTKRQAVKYKNKKGLCYKLQKKI